MRLQRLFTQTAMRCDAPRETASISRAHPFRRKDRLRAHHRVQNSRCCAREFGDGRANVHVVRCPAKSDHEIVRRQLSNLSLTATVRSRAARLPLFVLCLAFSERKSAFPTPLACKLATSTLTCARLFHCAGLKIEKLKRLKRHADQSVLSGEDMREYSSPRDFFLPGSRSSTAG